MENSSKNNSETAEPSLLLDAWETVVDVQQHFNDMEMRVRALCLTLLGTLLGAASYSYHQPSGSGGFSPLVTYYLLWVAFGVVGLFYFMDIKWYHLFLRGAVTAGQDLELEIQKRNVPVDLTASISRASHHPFLGRVMTSDVRGTFFYGVLAAVSFGFAVFSRTRDPYMIAGVGLVVFWAAALVFTALHKTSDVKGQTCAHCERADAVEDNMFCKYCRRRHKIAKKSPSAARVVSIAIVAAMFVSLIALSISFPQRAAADEHRIATQMGQRINYDLNAMSKRVIGNGELASLQLETISGTVAFRYEMPDEKWRKLSQQARALLVGPDGWFPRETELAWEKFHNGFLCTRGTDSIVQISVYTSAKQLLHNQDIRLQPC